MLRHALVAPALLALAALLLTLGGPAVASSSEEPVAAPSIIPAPWTAHDLPSPYPTRLTVAEPPIRFAPARPLLLTLPDLAPALRWWVDSVVGALEWLGGGLRALADFFFPSARAQVAFDAFTASAAATGTITITHNPVGTPRAAIVMCNSGNTADSFNAADYAGTNMPNVAGSPNVLAGGEGGNVSVFFLGASVPANDPATVTITVNDATSKNCTVITLTAAQNTEVVDSDGTINSTSQANPSVTLSLAARTSFASIVLYSGQNAPTGITPLTGWNGSFERDYGTDTSAHYRYNTINGVDVTCGWTQTADDAAAICVAVTEVLLQRYLVLNDAGCTVTALGTDAGCWASTSGGAGGAGVPTAGYAVFMDAASGAGTGTLDASLSITTGTYSSSGFAGTFALAGFNFTNTGTFTHSGGTITISTGALDVGASTVSASLTTSGAAAITMDSLTLSASTLAKGTASLTIQGALTMSGGDITSTSGTASVSGNVNISSIASAIDFGSESWTVSGTWTNSTTDATWDAGSGTVLFDSATGGTMTFANANLAEDEFFNVTFTSSAATSQTFTLATRGIRWGGTLTVTDTSGGTILAKATLGLTGGALTISGTAASGLTSTSGAVVVSAVSVSTATAYLDLGSEAWTVSGTWTNATTSASWDAGTGTVTFTSATGGTMTFAGANLAEAEFDSLTFTSSAGTAQTFTMSLRGLRWLSTLSIADASSTTALATAGLALGNAADSPSLSIGNGGILTASSSAVTLTTVTMTGGTTGTLQVTTGAWTLSGNWDTSGLGSFFTQGSTSLYTFNASATITLLSTDNTFSALTVSAGTATLGSDVVVTNTLTISGGTVAKNTRALTLGALTMSGGDLTSTSGLVTLTGNVSISSAASAVDFGSETWNISGTWTNASTDGAVWEAGTGNVAFESATGGTMTFAGANLAEAEFNDLRLESSAGTPQTFTMSTRALRIAGTLTVTDASSTTTLDSASLNIQANDIECGASGVLLMGTGNLVALTVLNIDGSMTMDTIAVSNIYMARTAGTGTVDVSAWTAWAAAPNVDVRWTSAFSVAGDTWQFVLEDVAAATSYDLKRNAAIIDTQASVGTVVTLSAVAGWGAADAMAIDEAVVCGANRYWVGGTGNWSDTARWSDSSGGASGCAVPTAANPVLIDIASCVAACTVTVDVNAAMASLTTAGFDDAGSTLALGTLNFAVSGNVTLAVSQLVMTIGASATNGLTATGTLTLSGGAISCVAAACDGDIDGAVSISAVGSYIDFGSGVWVFGGAWTNASTSASWDAGSGSALFDSVTGGTMTFGALGEDEFNIVTFTSSAGTAQVFTMATNGLRWAGLLTVSDGVSTTNLTTSGLALTNLTQTPSVTIGAGGILTAGSSSIIVAGNWDSSAGTFTVGTSTVEFAFTATIASATTSSFANLTVSSGTVTPLNNIDIDATFTISGGTYAKGTTTLNVDGGLTLSGGDLTSTSGAVTITGAVNVSAATSSIDLGSESWSVAGAWTNASTDAGWDMGTGTVTLTSATGGTLTFGGAPLGESEFYNLTLTSSAGTAQTFTMSTRGLIVGNTLTISDGTSTTNLSTSGVSLAITTVHLNVGAGGILTLNGSTLTVSGNLTVTGIYTANTSTLVLSGGAPQTIALNGTNVNALSVTGAGRKDFTQAFGSNSLSVTVTVTFRFTAGITWTHTGLTISATLGNILTLESSVPLSIWALTSAVGAVASRVSVSDSTASAVVDACDGTNVDGGGNTNWDFCVPVVGGDEPRGKGADAQALLLVSCTQVGLTGLRCRLDLSSDMAAGVLLERTDWFLNGRYVGSGKGDDGARQHTALLEVPFRLRGDAQVRVMAYLTNGQSIEKPLTVHMENMWVLGVALLMASGVAVVLLAARARRRPTER